MKIKTIFILFLISLLIASCTPVKAPSASNEIVGSGKLAAETRAVNAFDSVQVSGLGDLVVIQGETESLRIDAEDNFLPLIQAHVTNRVLHIELNLLPDQTLKPSKPITYTVRMKTIQELTLKGNGSITGHDISTDAFKLSINGSGQAQLDGACAREEVSINGGAKVDAGSMQCQVANVSIDGGGAVTVSASDSLVVTGKGVGVVNYYGDPKVTRDGFMLTLTHLEAKSFLPAPTQVPVAVQTTTMPAVPTAGLPGGHTTTSWNVSRYLLKWFFVSNSFSSGFSIIELLSSFKSICPQTIP